MFLSNFELNDFINSILFVKYYIDFRLMSIIIFCKFLFIVYNCLIRFICMVGFVLYVVDDVIIIVCRIWYVIFIFIYIKFCVVYNYK